MDADFYNPFFAAAPDADPKPTLSCVGDFVTSPREANRIALRGFRRLPA